MLRVYACLYLCVFLYVHACMYVTEVLRGLKTLLQCDYVLPLLLTNFDDDSELITQILVMSFYGLGVNHTYLPAL